MDRFIEGAIHNMCGQFPGDLGDPRPCFAPHATYEETPLAVLRHPDWEGAASPEKIGQSIWVYIAKK